MYLFKQEITKIVKKKKKKQKPTKKYLNLVHPPPRLYEEVLEFFMEEEFEILSRTS